MVPLEADWESGDVVDRSPSDGTIRRGLKSMLSSEVNPEVTSRLLFLYPSQSLLG